MNLLLRQKQCGGQSLNYIFSVSPKTDKLKPGSPNLGFLLFSGQQKKPIRIWSESALRLQYTYGVDRESTDRIIDKIVKLSSFALDFSVINPYN
jgi:hypothetical protein